MLYTHQTGFNRNPYHYQPHPVFVQLNQPFQQVVYSDRRLEHINCIIPESEDCGGLFIGDTIATLKTQYLTNNNIKAVLCCNSEAAKNIQNIKFPLDFKYLEIQDHVQYPIKVHFESASDFIDEKIKNKKNILVQCHGGASRSVTLVIAYLMKAKGWSLENTLKYVKQKRHRAKPNAGFWRQLAEYEILLSQNKSQQNQINFKTPSKYEKQEKMPISPAETWDKDERTETKSKENQLQLQKKSSEKMQSDKIFKSEQIIEPESEQIEKYHPEEKRRKNIFEDDDRKRNLVRQSEIISHQTPYQYFKQQHHRTPTHRTFLEPKIYPQQTAYHPPLSQTMHQSAIYTQPHQQTYTSLQTHQVYYVPIPQTTYSTYPNRSQPMYVSRAY